MVKFKTLLQISKQRLLSFWRAFLRLFYKLARLPWENILIGFAGLMVILVVSSKMQEKYLKAFNPESILSNLLVINGVFSAVLMTYLFTRITWSKERKREAMDEVLDISRKLTEFRRILHILISYYNIWENDNATKTLLDHNKFQNLDFNDYMTGMRSVRDTPYTAIANELYGNPAFSEGMSTLYLAMSSIVKERRNTGFVYQKELYKDYEFHGYYKLKTVHRWMNAGIFGFINSSLTENSTWIRYSSLSKENTDLIVTTASKINIKYIDYEAGNRLVRELAEDFESYYLERLNQQLTYVSEGIRKLNLLITILISGSLLFGILVPLILLLFSSDEDWFFSLVAWVAAINAGLIAFFLLKFPFLMNREIKLV